MRGIKILLFIVAAFASAGASAKETVWIASIYNGDKPGIGFRLVQNQRGISGSAYLLDPDHAHDFSHGVERKMEVTSASPREIRFKLDLGDGVRRAYILQFAEPLESKAVKGILREDPEDGTANRTHVPSQVTPVELGRV